MKLSKNMKNPENKFLGKDVIYTPEKGHPREFSRYKQTGDAVQDIQTFLQLQQRYRIGRIVEVYKSVAQGTNEPIYTAVLEIDTQKGKNLYKHGLLPKFVSPSIYQTKGEGWNDIQDFEALHLALVNSPSYNYRKARVTASCQNTPKICIKRLAQASTTNNTPVKKKKRSKLEEINRVLEFTGINDRR